MKIIVKNIFLILFCFIFGHTTLLEAAGVDYQEIIEHIKRTRSIDLAILSKLTTDEKGVLLSKVSELDKGLRTEIVDQIYKTILENSRGGDQGGAAGAKVIDEGARTEVIRLLSGCLKGFFVNHTIDGYGDFYSAVDHAVSRAAKPEQQFVNLSQYFREIFEKKDVEALQTLLVIQAKWRDTLVMYYENFGRHINAWGIPDDLETMLATDSSPFVYALTLAELDVLITSLQEPDKAKLQIYSRLKREFSKDPQITTVGEFITWVMEKYPPYATPDESKRKDIVLKRKKDFLDNRRNPMNLTFAFVLEIVEKEMREAEDKNTKRSEEYVTKESLLLLYDLMAQFNREQADASARRADPTWGDFLTWTFIKFGGDKEGPLNGNERLTVSEGKWLAYKRQKKQEQANKNLGGAASANEGVDDLDFSDGKEEMPLKENEVDSIYFKYVVQNMGAQLNHYIMHLYGMPTAQHDEIRSALRFMLKEIQRDYAFPFFWSHMAFPMTVDELLTVLGKKYQGTEMDDNEGIIAADPVFSFYTALQNLAKADPAFGNRSFSDLLTLKTADDFVRHPHSELYSLLSRPLSARSRSVAAWATYDRVGGSYTDNASSGLGNTLLAVWDVVLKDAQSTLSQWKRTSKEERDLAFSGAVKDAAIQRKLSEATIRDIWHAYENAVVASAINKSYASIREPLKLTEIQRKEVQRAHCAQLDEDVKATVEVYGLITKPFLWSDMVSGFRTTPVNLGGRFTHECACYTFAR